MFYRNFIHYHKKITSFTEIKKYCKLQIKTSNMLIDWEKNHALLFKVLKSIYKVESTNKFIYEHILIDL